MRARNSPPPKSPSKSSNRGRSPTRTARESPEVLHQLGRAVLAYSLRKISERTRDKRRETHSSRQPPGRRKDMPDETGARDESSRGPSARSDSGELHNLVSQVAVGVLAFGIRQYMHRRREAKREAAATARKPQRPKGPGNHRQPDQQQQRALRSAADLELSTAIDSLTKEVQNASESIRQLAYSAPSHRECAVQEALISDADRLQASLANIQTSANNMMNLHPDLNRPPNPPHKSRRRERTRFDEGQRRNEEPRSHIPTHPRRRRPS